MLRQFIKFACVLLLLSPPVVSQNLYITNLNYTSTGVTVFNIPMSCYGGNGVRMYVNDELVNATQGFCYYGICLFSYPFGTLKVGDKVYFKDGCDNQSNTVVAGDDYVYVEVPDGTSYSGNGISPTDEAGPYSRLSRSVNVGKCSPISLNSHALHDFFFGVGTNGTNNVTYQTGDIRINGVALTSSAVNISNYGVPSTTIGVSNGVISYNSGGLVRTKTSYSGRVPVSIEYKHNGVLPFDVQEFGFGPLWVRMWNNNSITIKELKYDGSISETNLSGDYSSSVFKITFDTGYFKLMIDGKEVKSIRRTVIYNSSSGTLSDTGLLDYATGVKWQPSGSGEQWVGATIDGIRYTRQKFKVSEDMLIQESVVNVGCYGGSTGSIQANVSGGQSPLTYSKDGTNYGSSNVFSGLRAGTYTISVRDASGCTAQKTITVSENSALTLSETVTNVTCWGGTDGSISVMASGGGGFYQYKIDGGTYSTSNILSNLSAGVKTYWVKDASGCEKSATATIGVTSSLAATVTLTDLSCYGDNSGRISINQTGTASGGVQYSLDGVNYQGSNIFNGLAANTYTVYIKDNLCSISKSNQVLKQPALLRPNVQVTKSVSCYGLSDGEIVAAPTGGTSAYQFSLDGTYQEQGSLEKNFKGLSSGNYKIWVKDSKGCVKDSIVYISQPSELQASLATKVDVSCFGGSNGSAKVDVIGGNGGNKFYIGNNDYGNSGLLGSLRKGSYTIKVLDSKSCETSTKVDILEPEQIKLEPSISKTVSCYGGNDGIISVKASGGTGALEYSLNGGSYGSSSVFNNLYSGLYQIRVKDTNACVRDSSNNLLSEPTLIKPALGVSDVLCYGGADGKVIVGARGGVGNYSFSKDGTTYIQDSTFSGFTKGTYTFYVKDGNACVQQITQAIGEASELKVSLSKSQDVWCYGGKNGKISAETNGGGTRPYQFSLNGSIYKNSTQTTHQIDTLKIGTYRVWVKDAHGCIAETNEVSLSESPEIIPSLASQKNVSCHSGSDGLVRLSQTGGYGSFSYSKDGLNFVSSSTFSGLSKGTYTFSLKDAYGCVKTINTTISEPAAAYSLKLVSQNNLSCNGNKSGQIEISNEGGTSPYRTWISVKTSDTLRTSRAVYTDLSATNYTIYGKDFQGCVSSYSFSLSEPSDIDIRLVSKKDVDCEAYSRGEAQFLATGSNGGFSYTLSGNDFLQNGIVALSSSTGYFGQLKSGDYVMTARDKNGCEKPYTLSIVPKSSQIQFEITKTLASTCLSTDGSINVINVRGGRQPYQYGLSGQNFGTSPNFTNLLNGTYIVTVADSLCSYKQTIDLKIPGSISAAYTISPINCNISNANLNIQPITGGNGNYQLSLNGGAYGTARAFQNLSPNVYQLSIEDSPLSCRTVLGIEIKEQNRADLSFKQRVNILCYGNNTGLIEIAGNNNLSPYQYALNNKNGTYSSSGIFSNLVAGTYRLYAKNSIGCIDSLQANLTQAPLLVNHTSQSNNLCYGDSTGSISISGSGGVSPYSFSIDGVNFQSSGTFGILKANTYTTFIKDQNQCIKTQSINLTQPSDIMVSPEYADTVRCFGEKNGKVIVGARGGTPSYQYSMDNVIYTSGNIFSNLGKGEYNFYVKDEHHCIRQSSLNLTEPDSLRLTLASTTNPLCYGSRDGQIKVVAVGGNGSNMYKLNGGTGQSVSTFTALGEGVYEVSVQDRRACSHSVRGISLSHPSALRHEVSLTEPQCYGGKDGKIEIRVEGGTPGYHIELGGTQFSPKNGSTNIFEWTNQSKGNFEYSTIDANQCRERYSLSLGEPTALGGEVRLTPNRCQGDSTGVLTLLAKGASPPYQYSILNHYKASDSTFSSTNYYPELLSRSYLARFRDSHGCRYDTLVQVQEPSKLEFEAYLSDSVRCYQETNGSIGIKARGGTPSYLYSLDNKNYQNSDFLRGLKSGYYKLFVKDKNACVASHRDSFYVAQPEELSLSVGSQSNPLCLGDSNGKIVLKVSGGNGGYIYIMDNSISQTNKLFENLSSGDYTFKVKDRKGCEDTLRKVSLRWPLGLMASSVVQAPRCLGESTGGVTLTLQGGEKPYSVKLDTMLRELSGSEYEFGKLSSGVYQIEAFDKNACRLVLPLTIPKPEALSPVSLAGDLRKGDSVEVCQGQKVSLSVQNPGRLVKWYYNSVVIDSLSNREAIEVEKPGKYLVEVSNSTGCTVKDSFQLTNNLFALKADFLIPTQAFVGDTIVCLDITKPIPDKVEWIYPDEFKLLSQNYSKILLAAANEGMFVIQMNAYSEACFNRVRHTIEILNSDQKQSTQTKGIITLFDVSPNANNGKFRYELKTDTNKNVEIFMVHSSSGKNIFSKLFENVTSIREEVDLKLVPGIYILYAKTDKEVLSKRILIF